MKENNYYKILQNYIDKVKELKKWLHKSEDEETNEYLNLEIKKQINMIEEHVNNKEN